MDNAEQPKMDPTYASLTPNEAERVAYAEKPGVELAMALAREKTGELSPLQNENVKAMEKAVVTYPNAFEEKSYGEGKDIQRVLIMKDRAAPNSTDRLIFTKNGIFLVGCTNPDKDKLFPWDDKLKYDYSAISDYMGETPGEVEIAANSKKFSVPKEKFIDSDDLQFAEKTEVSARRLVVSAKGDKFGEVPLEIMKDILNYCESKHKNDRKSVVEDHSMSLLFG